MNYFEAALDLETATLVPDHREFALQPYRALLDPPQAEITALAISDGLNNQLYKTEYQSALDSIKGKKVLVWNGIFDIAWLLAKGYDVSNINWVDSMLLWKWLMNSQRTEHGGWRWSLAHGVEYFKQSLPNADRFIDFKKNAPLAGENTEYWDLRARLDTFYTLSIGNLIWLQLTERQKKLAIIEAMNLIPVAQSWLNGIWLDLEAVQKVEPEITQEMSDIEFRLGVNIRQQNKTEIWRPSPVLRSPKKLSELLYDVWKLPVEFYTDKGAPSTNKASLTYLADKNEKCLEILRWRELNTQLTKFVQGFNKSCSYLQMGNKCFPSPFLFSTKTGRMTYSSKTTSEVN